MLKSVNRLKKDNDFQAVQRSGTKVKTAHLVGSFLVNGLDETRVGVVISKKVNKLAVRRNRVRRVILAEAAELLRQNRPKTSVDIVLRVSSLPDSDESVSIRREVGECFAKLLSR